MKIDFVLPVTMSEKLGSHGAWRGRPDVGVRARLGLLLLTFLAFFPSDELESFLLICPDDETCRLDNLLRLVTTSRKFKVVPESEILGPLGRSGKNWEIGGWQIQQMIKLGAAHVVSSPIFVTLDSDIVCTRRFSSGDLSFTESGRIMGLMNIETAETYQSLYTSAFAEEELLRKHQRQLVAKVLLRSGQHKSSMTAFMGETPCVLNVESVLNMLNRLSSQWRMPWQKLLSQTPGWTEYSLYLEHLVSNASLRDVHHLCGSRTVLDLQQSVWQPSNHYRENRVYDRAHFCESRDNCGPFIAIQSWISPRCWLPADKASVEEFYVALSNWLLPTEDAERYLQLLKAKF